MREYTKLLKEIQIKENCSEIEAYYYLRQLSELMRDTEFAVDSLSMQKFVENCCGLDPKDTELLWELTETDKKIVYKGVFLGASLTLSIPLQSTLEKLLEFEAFIGKNFEVSETCLSGWEE